MKKQHVVIVGAGASGLMVASLIMEKCDVTIVEARHVVGGRIRTMQAVASGVIIEEGAEFLHGDTPITNALLKEANLKPTKLDGKMFRKEGKEWTEEEDMIEGWDELVEKMKGQRRDVTMLDFINEHFGDAKYSDLRRHVQAFVEGFDVAGIDEVSVKSLYKEWSKEGDQFRLENGYGALVDHLAQKCESGGVAVMSGETVRQIDWQKNEVIVYMASGTKINANKVVVTVPISVLRSLNNSASINVTPPVDDYINAARNIGFGTVIKVIFELKEKLWKKDTGFLFSNEMIPTWWTQHPFNNNLITGWVGGPAASKLSEHTDDELINIAVISLSRILDMAGPDDLRNIIGKYYVFNWSKYAESLGAYSFSTPESQSARELLNTPLDETLFFSGEGVYDGPFSGTVEAALSSGKTTAARLLQTL